MATARIDFGMDLEEFLDITPRFFDALLQKDKARAKRAQEMTEIMGAQIVAMVRSCGFVQFKEPMAAREFMPSEWDKPQVAKKTKRRSRAAIADEYRAVMTAVTGRAAM